jgi:hypothetical protein
LAGQPNTIIGVLSEDFTSAQFALRAKDGSALQVLSLNRGSWLWTRAARRLPHHSPLASLFGVAA